MRGSGLHFDDFRSHLGTFLQPLLGTWVHLGSLRVSFWSVWEASGLLFGLRWELGEILLNVAMVW